MKHLRLLLALLTLIGGGNLYAQTDVTATYIVNPGFEDCTARTDNLGASGTAAGDNYADAGWTLAQSAAWSSSAVVAYGGTGQVNGVNAPSADNAGNSGNALGVSVGWDGTNKYQSTTAVILPAGHYELKVYAYNNLSGKTQFKSVFGFVPTSGSSYLSTKTSFTYGTWETDVVTFDLAEETEGKFQIGGTAISGGSGNNAKVFFDNITLTWTDPLEAIKINWRETFAAAQAVIENADYANVTGEERTALATEIAKTEPTTKEGYEEAIEALKTATNAFTAAKTNYDAFISEKAYAESLGMTVTETATSAEEAATATNTIKVNEYNYVTENFPKDFTSTYLATPTTNTFSALTAQHWSGEARSYFDFWSGSSADRELTYAIKLPAGKYIIKAAGRGQANTPSSVTISDGTTTVPFFMKGDTGLGINKAGVTSFDANDAAGFANNNAGRGWEWRYLLMTLEEETEVTLSLKGHVQNSWIGACDFALLTTADNTAISKAAYDETLAVAKAVDLDQPMNADVKAAMQETLTTYGDKTFSSDEEYQAAINALETATENVNNSVAAYVTIKYYIDYALSLSKSGADFADINNAYDNGTYADNTEAAAIYEQYQAIEMAALKAAEADDYTSVIINPSFETGNMTGWSAESRNDTGVKANSNGTYTTSGVDGSYLFNSWGGSTENNVYQTIKNVPAGTYQLSALLAGFPGEELVLAANETTNSVTVEGTKGDGYTVNVIFTLDDAADVTIKASNTKSQEGSDASFIKADNFTLKAFSDPLAALKDQLATLQDEATTALASEDYANVAGSEKTTLETLSTATPEETEEAYTTAIEDITAALSAFKAAKTAYDSYAASAALTQDELPYANEDKYAAIATAKEAPANAEEAAAKATDIVTAIRAYVESNARAEKVEGAVNYDSAIEAANADTNTGWTNGIGTNQGQGYTDADGNVAAKYLDGGWSASAGVNIDMKREVNVPAGKYILTVTARGAENLTEYTLSIGGETVNLPHIGDSNGVFGRGWNDAYVVFESDGTPQTLEIIAKSTDYYQWMSINRFRLTQLEKNEDAYAKAEDYAALTEAIEAAEAKTLGFDAEEYAPYNNVDAIKALAAAKAVDTEAENLKEVVTGATAALTAAAWTVNTDEVNAIFDGTFATTEANTTTGDINLPGWTKVNGIRLLVKDEATDPGLAFTDGKAAVFSWGGTTLTYGEQEGYTLPMNKYSIYELTLKVSGWRDGDLPNWFSVELDGASQNVVPTVGRINAAEGNPFAELKFYVTPTADNSILKVHANHHFAIADLSMKLAVAEDVTFEDAATEAPAHTYANVNYERTLVAGYNTLVLPFDVTKEEIGGDAVEEVYAYNGCTVTGEGEEAVYHLDFQEVEETLKANTPYLVKMKEAKSGLSFTGKEIAPATAEVANEYFTFVGTYTALAKGNEVIQKGDYISVAAGLKKAAGGNKLNAFRAYLKNNTGNEDAGVRVFIDGEEATGIQMVEIMQSLTEGVFNLQGQKVNAARKGIYIVNGKKVVIK